MTAVAITGMHRSGTSLVAHMLGACGLYLGPGRELMTASADNAPGYFENVRFVAVNEEVLDVLGGAWDLPPTVDGLSANEVALALLEERAQALVREFADRRPWGWKDPRTSLTLAFWRRIVPEVRVVLCVRNPLEVVLSLRRRGASSYLHGLRLWRAYNEAALEHTTAQDRLVVHYDALLSDPGRELARLIDFAGLSPTPEEVEEATGAARQELRHQRFTTANLLEVDAEPDLIDLYVDLCRESGCQEPVSMATAKSGEKGRPRPSTRMVDTPALDRDVLTRQVAMLRSALADREAAFAQLEERAAKTQAELDAMRRTVDDLGERLALVLGEYLPGGSLEIVGRIRAVAREVVPAGAKVLVLSEGDERLIRLRGVDGWHFPRLADGRYSGFHPAGDTSAIGQLEAARARGAEFFLIPTVAEWWFDHYPLFARHLERRFRRVAAFGACSIYDLRAPLLEEEAPWWMRVRRTVEECETRLGSGASVLDWGTGLDLEGFLSDRPVLSPPTDDASLPYEDGTVDVVVTRGDERLPEARRVARALLVRVTGQAPNVSIASEWVGSERASDAQSVSIVADGRESVRAVLEAIPAGMDCEVLAIGDPGPWAEQVAPVPVSPGASAGERWNRAGSVANGDLLVFVRRGSLLLPDGLPPLARLFRREDIGAAGVKVLSEEGALVEAGAAVRSDGTIERLGSGDYRVDAPAYGHVREVDACSQGVLVTPRSLFEELSGFEGGYEAADCELVDYCLRVNEADRRICYQPESTAVALDFGTPTTDDEQRLAVRASRPLAVPS